MKLQLYWVLLVVILFGCASPQPSSTLATARVDKWLRMLPITPVNDCMPFIYPPGLDTTNFSWFLQSSTNLIDWQFVRPTGFEDCLEVQMTKPFEFFRMIGFKP